MASKRSDLQKEKAPGEPITLTSFHPKNFLSYPNVVSRILKLATSFVPRAEPWRTHTRQRSRPYRPITTLPLRFRLSSSSRAFCADCTRPSSVRVGSCDFVDLLLRLTKEW